MTNPVLIVDSSPLISLAVVDKLDLLRKLYTQVVAPPMVWEEVTMKGKGLPGAELVGRLKWLEIRTPSPALLHPLDILVDHDEAEVLALAQETLESITLLDDAQARRIAERLGIRRIGTLGILRKAKMKGFVPELLPLIKTPNEHGICIHERIVHEVLRDVGERLR